jgi:formylglycine-generating enzyme required for sulfatase activity
MHGNVLQWCKDAYEKDYQNSGKKDSSDRVARGGFWLLDAKDCRSARRRSVDAGTRGSGLGFRVVVRSRQKKDT